MMQHKTSATRGFTLIEFVVVISLISILGVIVLDRYWKWRAAAEQVAVETIVGNLKSTIGMEVARRALHNELHLIPNLVSRNPMELLAQKPNNYRGESATPISEPQVWYYDKTRRELIYNLSKDNSTDSSTAQSAHHEIRLRVELIFNDKNRNGQYDKGEGIAGLDINPVQPYQWNKDKLSR